MSLSLYCLEHSITTLLQMGCGTLAAKIPQTLFLLFSSPPRSHASLWLEFPFEHNFMKIFRSLDIAEVLL